MNTHISRKTVWRLAFVITIASGILHAAAIPFTIVKEDEFYCGSEFLGTVSVEYDSEVRIKAGPFPVASGDSRGWTAVAGMKLKATAEPAFGVSGAHWAWMQAVTANLAPAVTVRDQQNVVLNAPWPDPPPGGTTTQLYSYKPEEQSADYDPWYGNNLVGELILEDFPALAADPFFGGITGSWTGSNFESWLVCVLENGNADKDYTVIPMIGFKWGYDFVQLNDGPDPGNIAGDFWDEYVGSTHFVGLIPGGQPSASFKQAYGKYFEIDYLENNEQNCRQHCGGVPDTSSSLTLLSSALMVLGVFRRTKAGGSSESA